jgi:hypothetical protein
MVDDPPTQVSIRTDDGNAWRYNSIQRAADFYGVNRSDAVAFACEDVSSIAAAVQTVLEREDLTDKQCREIAERFDRAARGLSVSTERVVNVTPGGNG